MCGEIVKVIPVDVVVIPVDVVTDNLELPKYATAHSSGMDVAYNGVIDIVLTPGERRLVPTGLFVAIPVGYEIQVRPRSGLALKHGITLVNSPGTIDADYRGEIGVIMMNNGQQDFVVTPGMRIAQLVLAKVEIMEFNRTDVLPSTDRGEGGFGHSGTH